MGSSWVLGTPWEQVPWLRGLGPLSIYALLLSCSVSDAEGNLVVREVATRPLTQDLLSHEVRGSGDPPAHCSLAPLPQARKIPGGLGWAWEGETLFVCEAVPVQHFQLHQTLTSPDSRTVTSWTRGA